MNRCLAFVQHRLFDRVQELGLQFIKNFSLEEHFQEAKLAIKSGISTYRSFMYMVTYIINGNAEPSETDRAASLRIAHPTH